jgi:predicted Zn-dependent protease
LTICNPTGASRRTHWRKAAFIIGFAGALLTLGAPALQAQPRPNNAIFALRDTETEELLRSYEVPLARAAGMDVNAVRVFIMGDMSINAFATQPQDIFIFAGMLLDVKTPNELIGVMAHETGHLSGGHLTRSVDAMNKASVPMLLSLVVWLAVMIAGGGPAGSAIMGMGQVLAQNDFNAFSRVQESSADQIGFKLLTATRQSPMGMYNTFIRFAQEQARSAYKVNPFAVSHPVGQDRVSALTDLVENSPYRDVPDPPQSVHALQMVQAKLAGFILPPDETMKRYPLSNTSSAARYARAMAYMKKPDLQKALAEINSLIAEEPNNPYFHEVLGQINVMMAKPALGIPAYQKAVSLKPQAPQLRTALAVAQLAMDDPRLAPAALGNLKVALLAEEEEPFTWYQVAKAYSMMQNPAMADLATAESNYNGGNLPQAFIFASRARSKLPQGSSDWQRANDIIGATQGAMPQQRR